MCIYTKQYRIFSLVLTEAGIINTIHNNTHAGVRGATDKCLEQVKDTLLPRLKSLCALSRLTLSRLSAS